MSWHPWLCRIPCLVLHHVTCPLVAFLPSTSCSSWWSPVSNCFRIFSKVIDMLFFIWCRARHDSCDGRSVTKRVGISMLPVPDGGQTSEISISVRKQRKQTNQTNKTPPKHKTNKTQTKNIDIFQNETVRRETYRMQTLNATLICPCSAKKSSSSTGSHITKHFLKFSIQCDWTSLPAQGHWYGTRTNLPPW